MLGWVRKCLKGYSKELVVKGQKKEVVRGGKTRERGRTIGEMLRRKERRIRRAEEVRLLMLRDCFKNAIPARLLRPW